MGHGVAHHLPTIQMRSVKALSTIKMRNFSILLGANVHYAS